MQQELFNQDINQIATQIYNNAFLYNSRFKFHIFFMYHYGVRIGEVFDNHILFDNINNQLIIQPQKRNNKRIITQIARYTAEHLERLYIMNELQQINYKSLQREISKLAPYRCMKNGNKNISTHIFRHNYIKQLEQQGYTQAQITTHMGYKSNEVAEIYTNSKLTI